ncbi:hypothetical protein Drorol1_Dr00018430 [Drosera rotundifolia]
MVTRKSRETSVSSRSLVLGFNWWDLVLEQEDPASLRCGLRLLWYAKMGSLTPLNEATEVEVSRAEDPLSSESKYRAAEVVLMEAYVDEGLPVGDGEGKIGGGLESC